MKIKKGDTVQIILGKDRGKTGRVLSVLVKKNQVLVEGINVYKKHLKKRGQKEGGIIDIVKPLDTSNVLLLCPNCKKPGRVGFRVEGGQKLRFCHKCKEIAK